MTDKKPVTRTVATRYARSTKPLAIEPADLREFVKAMAEAAHKDEADGRKGEAAFRESEAVDWPIGDIEPEGKKG